MAGVERGSVFEVLRSPSLLPPPSFIPFLLLLLLLCFSGEPRSSPRQAPGRRASPSLNSRRSSCISGRLMPFHPPGREEDTASAHCQSSWDVAQLTAFLLLLWSLGVCEHVCVCVRMCLHVCVSAAKTILGMAGGGGVIGLEKAEGYKSLTGALWSISSQTIYDVNMN